MKSPTLINRYLFGWVNSSNSERAIKYGCCKTKYFPEGVRRWFNIRPDWFNIYLSELQCSVASSLTLIDTEPNYSLDISNGFRLLFIYMETNIHTCDWHKWKKSGGDNTMVCAWRGWLMHIDVFDLDGAERSRDLHERALLVVCKRFGKWADLLHTTWSTGTFTQVKKGHIWS